MVITASNQVVVYMGDDETFEYVYKFVAGAPFNPDDRAANMDILDTGALHVAKFNDDGSGVWLPLVTGQNGVDGANGFPTQAEICANTRMAADLAGATMMDRPEDIEWNTVNGRIYAAMTKNANRGPEGKANVDAANPRPENKWGHIIEMMEEGGDAAAGAFTWQQFILAGAADDDSTDYAGFDKSAVAPFANPDNITFDAMGNLWIATDGQPGSLEINDGLYAVPVEGPERGRTRQMISVPIGAEISGPWFTPDNTTLFATVQHPGEGSTFDAPSTSWPGASGPPRPAVIIIQAENGGAAGQS